jgi:hypothetical protein
LNISLPFSFIDFYKKKKVGWFELVWNHACAFHSFLYCLPCFCFPSSLAHSFKEIIKKNIRFHKNTSVSLVIVEPSSEKSSACLCGQTQQGGNGCLVYISFFVVRSVFVPILAWFKWNIVAAFSSCTSFRWWK